MIPAHRPATVCFGLFEFNPQVGELRKQGLKIKLCAHASQVLRLLLEHPGRVQTREGLRERLWGADTLTDFEQRLNKAIHELREALGDSAISPRYIQTVPGEGYKFIPLPQEGGPMAGQKLWQAIAVLPFSSESAAFLGNYAASGLINSLSNGSGLRVLAYSVVKQYTGTDTHPQNVGRNLDVQGVVAGEVIRHNAELIVRAELIDVEDGGQLWGTHLKRAFDDEVEGIQQIVEELCRQLVPVLMSVERAGRSVSPPISISRGAVKTPLGLRAARAAKTTASLALVSQLAIQFGSIVVSAA